MPLNSNQLLAVFPHPVLTKIVIEPNLASITLQQSKHNGNLALIKSNLGDGLTGLMVLSMKPEIFKTNSRADARPSRTAPSDTLLRPRRIIPGPTQDPHEQAAPTL